MFNAWFVLYHKYSRQAWYDEDAVKQFARDCKWAGKNNIRLLIIEDYFRNYPEFLSFWSRKTLREFLRIAHDQGIQVLPYTTPTGIDVTSDFYKFHGEECCVKVRSVFGTISKVWGFQSLPDGGPYWEDYRGTHLLWVPADPCTGWRDYYLEQCEGLLGFGFDGIYIDQHQESTESVEHPEINKSMVEMLKSMRKMVKEANPENAICANVMSGAPEGKKGREFVRRTKVADYGLTESADSDIKADLQSWMDQTNLKFFFFSHGTFESHKRKVRIAKSLKQPLCLFVPTPLGKADPRILKLYETK